MVASPHPAGTNGTRQQETIHLPQRLRHSTARQRYLPKTAADVHAATPADDPATASAVATHDQPVDSSTHSSQLLTLEVLQRPIESTQFTSIRYGGRLAELGAVPPIGSVGDSFDNALAETVNGLYKTLLIRGPDQGPWRTIDDVELATLGGVHWYNTERHHGYLDDVPPVEYEEAHYIATLERLVTERGALRYLRMDNGPELIAWRLVPPARSRHHLHRTRLSLGEPLGRVIQRPGPRRAVEHHQIRIPDRSTDTHRRLEERIQHLAAALGGLTPAEYAH